jgi:CHAT domain-containing protein
MAIDILNKIDYKALSKTDKVGYWRTCFSSNYDSYYMSKAKSASYNLWILENPKKDSNSIYTAQHYANMALCYHFDTRGDSALIFSEKALKILRQNKKDIAKIDVHQIYRAHACATRNNYPIQLNFIIKAGKLNDDYTHVMAEKYIMAYFDSAMFFCEKQYGKNSKAFSNLLRNRANAQLDYYQYYLKNVKEKSENCHSQIVALYKSSNQILKKNYGANNPGIADNFLLLGLTEFYNGRQKKALQYFNKSKELIFYKDENNQVSLCSNSQALDYYRYTSLAYSLDFKENKKQLVALKCIELFKEAVPIYLNHLQELNLTASEAIVDPYDQNPLASLSGIYIEMYEMTKNKNYLDSAFYYSEKLKRLSLFYFNNNKDLSQQITKQLIEIENSVLFKKKIINKNKNNDIYLINMNSISIKKIQSNLKPNEAFISYSFVNSNLYGEVFLVFVITKTKKEYVRLSTEKKHSIIQKTTNFNLLKDSAPIVFKKYSNLLYENFFKPIIPIIGTQINHLYIVPSKKLNDFPFELLVTKNATTNKYNYSDFLISKYSISYLLSASFGLTNKKQKNNTYGINILIPNLSTYNLTALPFCSKISENIADDFENSKVNNLATTADFYSASNNPNHILQLFTHSAIDNQNTANSKLFFSDNAVLLNEIYNNKISCPLIFLSSCETDIGLNSEYDGQLNFVRALNFAGAKSIVSTFWKSDDKAAAYISLYFYSYLAKGFNKAEALQKAQQEFITNFPQLSNPLYWGAFKITGDICNLQMQESAHFSNLSIFLTLFAVALLVGYLLFIKK